VQKLSGIRTIMNKRTFIKLHSIIVQFGFDPLKFIKSLRAAPFFLKDLIQFKKGFPGKLTIFPSLHDRHDISGSTNSEYFWQDLHVAQWVFENNPVEHVDVGSKMDGFVSHVASFRLIRVLDVRPNNVEIKNIMFEKIDLMDSDKVNKYIANSGTCDSLSCLHSIEHFGLGRYGDRLSHNGYKEGILNLSKLLEKNGVLYLSTPVGRERVEFNSHWIFNPKTIISNANINNLELSQFISIQCKGKKVNIKNIRTEGDYKFVASMDYSLGVFVFKKS